MFVCKLGTPSCCNYEHFHVYLVYRRQTGTVVTRQTCDRAPRLTNHPLHTFQGVMDSSCFFIDTSEYGWRMLT